MVDGSTLPDLDQASTADDQVSTGAAQDSDERHRNAMRKNLMQAKIKVQYSSFQRLALITLDNVRTSDCHDEREDAVICLDSAELKDLLRKLINKCVVPR